MKYIINKQYDRLADDYLKDENVEAEIFYDPALNNVIMEVDNVKYILPEQIFRGLKFE